MHDNYDYDGVLVQLWTLSLFKIEKKNTKHFYEYKKKIFKKNETTNNRKKASSSKS